MSDITPWAQDWLNLGARLRPLAKTKQEQVAVAVVLNMLERDRWEREGVELERDGQRTRVSPEPLMLEAFAAQGWRRVDGR